MGSGKGSNSYWVASVTTGAVIFEVTGIKKLIALEIFKKTSIKLPIKTCIVQVILIYQGW